ncbi:C40 family peptidase [Thermomonospora umbrina]|uniref:Cell wall-associated NlpC family hydrolase n=1 Tax=Thermomonospora umbrina TaxID=111806 RepID=A0A3D9SWS6_9ACTN|nr:C40 family peptidase [Thermomonospora umbrina]REE96081.1 cell wall-associated NlpC family hydrolase [Thermomonospora umbrina]
MRRPSRRVLPTVIGVGVLTSLAVNGALVASWRQAPDETPVRAGAQRYVAASSGSYVSPTAVAPLGDRATPHLMAAATGSLPSDVVERVRGLKGVDRVEVMDAAQAMVGNKRVGLLGVDPSTFRAFTPKPTAQSDDLWRNIAGGDIAISFTMGNDGGVRLGTQIPVGGQQRQSRMRVGAYATMGLGDVDAVISRTAARSLGVPAGNAVLISAESKTDRKKLAKALRKLLPKGTKTVEVNPEIDVPAPGGSLPKARGQVMNALQVQTVIRAAHTRLGWPYVWGGESESEGGYDCSGLMQYAFARAGIKLPRVAADQARAGWVLPYSKARPGDMLIWANDPTAPGYISHIALYLGEGKMLAAPRRGTVVQVQDVYTNNMKGAVRVNPQMGARLADSGL